MSAIESMGRVLAELGIDPSGEVLSIVDVDSFQQKQVKHFMEQAGRDVVQRAEWPSLYLTYTIPLGASDLFLVEFGAFPYQDFRTFGTGANVVTTLGPARVVLNSTTWSDLQDQELDSPYVFVEGDTTLRSSVNLRGAKIGYYSWGWVNHGPLRSRYLTGNSDTFRIPEHLVELGAVWRWKRSKGRPYDGELKEYESEIAIGARNAKAAV